MGTHGKRCPMIALFPCRRPRTNRLLTEDRPKTFEVGLLTLLRHVMEPPFVHVCGRKMRNAA